MTTKLVECIPNFSEGRDEKILNKLKEVARVYRVAVCLIFSLTRIITGAL